MPSIESRKLFKCGKSIVVPIPRGWLNWKRLKPGDRVVVRTNHKLTIDVERKGREAQV